MKKNLWNIIIGCIGIIAMLMGLILLSEPRLSIPLTGIGGSVLATALINWLLTRPLANIPVGPIIEALAQKTEFMRMHQVADLIFSIENNCMKLEKRHRYHLRNPHRFTRSGQLSMFTDRSPSTFQNRGGFILVLGPDGAKLEGETLAPYVKWEFGKHVFRKKYTLQHGDQNAFEFRSISYYRMTDRLIWTIEDLSEDFLVYIKNHTDQSNPFTVKVNHHRAKEIQQQLSPLEHNDEIMFQFNTEILPYQGFEISWNLSEDKTKSLE